MNLTPLTTRFTIRHGECDSLRHLYTGSYFRLMQEAAVALLIREGGTLNENGRVWSPDLAYLDMMTPLHMNDDIAIAIEPSGLANNRMSLAFTFCRQEPGGGETVTSSGAIDWSLRRLEDLKPPPTAPAAGQTARPLSTLAAKISTQNSPAANTDPNANAPRPPAVTTVPEGAIRHRVPIGWCDISQEQVVYNASYMDSMVDAAMQAGITYGWTWERLHKEGFVFVAKKQWLGYHASAGLSDEVEVTTWLANVRRSSARRQYLIHRVSDGLLLAEGHTLFVTVDIHSGRPVRIPEHFKQNLAPHISPEV
jgi:acyl-CoA thioester hydrolase